MRILLFAAISFILNSLSYGQVKAPNDDPYTKSINQQQEAIDNFDFSRYNPLVEKQIKEDFSNFKAEMEIARDQNPNIKATQARTKAFYDRDNANIERWSKKISPTSHPKRRTIQTY
jgi:hypothetical protein